MKNMEYISMERVESLSHESTAKTPVEHENYLCNAAIADYLKTVGDGVELPRPVKQGPFGNIYTESQLRQAIAPYAARLKQAEDVLRMAREDIVLLGRLANVDHTGPRASVAAINQQLGEK